MLERMQKVNNTDLGMKGKGAVLQVKFLQIFERQSSHAKKYVGHFNYLMVPSDFENSLALCKDNYIPL